MSDTDNELTVGQEDGVENGTYVLGEVAARASEVESLLSAASSEVEEGTNVDNKLKR